ncbi:MAG: DUF2321 domain-containing protein [Candidatus Binatus sp.]|uniref:DUF2321 domain-containing protein n=1 Tax=Candidatus Binatus sp. TaxID=2811406 RepID=UPI002725827D|nr:DUF2321 domain-containing protein [Candidatus Binatus sp.]MDO8431028.1 DUF2321 domain-containing protein [Candidatus Binatus sp.]
MLQALLELAQSDSLTAAYERLDRWKRRALTELRRVSTEEAQAFEFKKRAFAITDSESIFQTEIEMLSEFLRGFRAEIDSVEDNSMQSARGTRDIAQICIAGHVANTRFRDMPEFNKAFCERCGSNTITECLKCGRAIPGGFPEVLRLSEDPPPKFCVHCGSPYPWTSLALELAFQLSDDSDKLSIEQRDELKSGIRELVQESARTPLAVISVKKLLNVAGTDVTHAANKVLAEVISEAIKRQIWGDLADSV